MREDRQFLQMIIRLLYSKLGAENRIASACVDQVASTDGLRRAVPLDAKIDMFIREGHGLDHRVFMYFSTVFCRMIEQQLVEIGARHLIGMLGLRAICVLEIKFISYLGAGAEHFTAEFFHKPRAQNFFMQIHARECLHTERQERLADVEARKILALENNHPASSARQEGCSGAAGRSPTDDRDVIDVAEPTAGGQLLRSKPTLDRSNPTEGAGRPSYFIEMAVLRARKRVDLHPPIMLANSTDFGRDSALRGVPTDVC